jgi:hypothetical protein
MSDPHHTPTDANDRQTGSQAIPCRVCAQCSGAFQPAKPWQAFCGSVCQQRFHDIDAKRGKVLVGLFQVGRTSKSGKTELNHYALAQAQALADMWNRVDKANGRNPALVIERKRRDGWVAADVG